MTLKHVSGSLSFTTNKDACTVNGSLPSITGPLSLAGAAIHVDIGGAAVDFTLAKTGRAKSAEGTIRLSTKPKLGALPFTVVMKKRCPRSTPTASHPRCRQNQRRAERDVRFYLQRHDLHRDRANQMQHQRHKSRIQVLVNGWPGHRPGCEATRSSD